MTRKLLERGADVNYRDDKKGSSPLIRAVARRRGIAFMELLVSHGADLNYRAPLAATPLLNAAIANDIEAVRFLVANGADLKKAGDAGNALHDACAMGFFEMVKELIALGMDVEARNAIGQTALTQAVSLERFDLVQLLLDAGASPYSGGPEATAADWAAEFGSAEMKKLLGIKT